MCEDHTRGAIRVDLLRHGETTHSGFCGSVDSALTPHGWLQMRAAVQNGGPWDVIVTSPMRRCAAFAEEFATTAGVPLQCEPRLSEYHFGSWEGCTAEQIWREDPTTLERFWHDPWTYSPPGAESMEHFGARVEQSWADVSREHAGRRILLITHAGVIRMLWQIAHRVPREAFLHLQVAHGSLLTLIAANARGGR